MAAMFVTNTVFMKKFDLRYRQHWCYRNAGRIWLRIVAWLARHPNWVHCLSRSRPPGYRAVCVAMHTSCNAPSSSHALLRACLLPILSATCSSTPTFGGPRRHRCVCLQTHIHLPHIFPRSSRETSKGVVSQPPRHRQQRASVGGTAHTGHTPPACAMVAEQRTTEASTVPATSQQQQSHAHTNWSVRGVVSTGAMLLFGTATAILTKAGTYGGTTVCHA